MLQGTGRCSAEEAFHHRRRPKTAHKVETLSIATATSPSMKAPARHTACSQARHVTTWPHTLSNLRDQHVMLLHMQGAFSRFWAYPL